MGPHGVHFKPQTHFDIASEKMKHLQATLSAARKHKAKNESNTINEIDRQQVDKPVGGVGALSIALSVLKPIAQCHAKQKHSAV